MIECIPMENLRDRICEIQDHLLPRLDTYEQAIYLYIFRHSRLIGHDEIVLGLKSARRRIALGIGEKGKPMAEGTAYEKLRSLASKGFLEVLGTEREGTRLRLLLPREVPGCIENPEENAPSVEDQDFFEDETGRAAILQRPLSSGNRYLGTWVASEGCPKLGEDA